MFSYYYLILYPQMLLSLFLLQSTMQKKLPFNAAGSFLAAIYGIKIVEISIWIALLVYAPIVALFFVLQKFAQTVIPWEYVLVKINDFTLGLFGTGIYASLYFFQCLPPTSWAFPLLSLGSLIGNIILGVIFGFFKASAGSVLETGSEIYADSHAFDQKNKSEERPVINRDSMPPSSFTSSFS